MLKQPSMQWPRGGNLALKSNISFSPSPRRRQDLGVSTLSRRIKAFLVPYFLFMWTVNSSSRRKKVVSRLFLERKHKQQRAWRMQVAKRLKQFQLREIHIAFHVQSLTCFNNCFQTLFPTFQTNSRHKSSSACTECFLRSTLWASILTMTQMRIDPASGVQWTMMRIVFYAGVSNK